MKKEVAEIRLRPELVGKFQSQLGTATQTAVKAEDHSTVAFLEVPPGSRRIRGG